MKYKGSPDRVFLQHFNREFVIHNEACVACHGRDCGNWAV